MTNIRASLLPFTWDTQYVKAFDRAFRKTREGMGLYHNVMADMVNIDRLPEPLLDNAGLRWGALAWPVEDFINDAAELESYKRQVLRQTYDLNEVAGRIINGKWEAGDIISHDLRRLDYEISFGHVVVRNGIPDDASFVTPAPNDKRINAAFIEVLPRTSAVVSPEEQDYLRRVYRAHLPFLMYLLPVRVSQQRIEIVSYADIYTTEAVEVFL